MRSTSPARSAVTVFQYSRACTSAVYAYSFSSSARARSSSFFFSSETFG